MDPVARHYGVAGILDAVLNPFRAQGKDLDRLSPADLEPVDEFHIRGREATAELAGLAAPQAGSHVLDIGSGLGGSARFLANKYGCRVTGVDITQSFCEAAAELSRLVGLNGLTEFHCRSATAMPFEDGAFDLAWTQHVQMNIPDKPALYREIARVLRPGGRFVFHDILAGPGGEPHYPVHWANGPELSFLIAPGDLRALLEDCGFRVIEWRDTTAVSRDWFLAVLERRKKGEAPPPSLQLLLGETARAKFENAGRNLREERIIVFQALLEKG